MVGENTVEHTQFDHTVWLSNVTFLFDSSGHSIFVGFSDTDAKPPTEFDPNQHNQDHLIYLEDLFWMVNRAFEELQDVDHVPYAAGVDDNTNWLVKRVYERIEDSLTFVVPGDGSDTIEIHEDDLPMLTDYTERLISAQNREMILLRDGHKDHLIHGTQPLCAAASESGVRSPTVKLPNPAEITGKESKQPNFVSPSDGYNLSKVFGRSSKISRKSRRSRREGMRR